MEVERKKRNYVKRKRSLDECTKTILQTLQSINQRSSSPSEINNLKAIAFNHAKTIEAACWSRRAKLSNQVFTQIVRAKTMELCKQLIMSANPSHQPMDRLQIRECAREQPTSNEGYCPSNTVFLINDKCEYPKPVIYNIDSPTIAMGLPLKPDHTPIVNDSRHKLVLPSIVNLLKL